jgi:hypothetical protein
VTPALTPPPPAEVAPAVAPDQRVPSVAPDAAEAPPSNAVYAELLGNGLLYSINYERMLPAYHLGLRAGASFFTDKISSASGSGNLTLASFPFVASYYLGPPRHKLELGLGATILYVDAASDSTGTKYQGSVGGLGIAATAVIGYRYVPRGHGVTFGAGFTPLLRETKGFLPWGGAMVGWAF